jgi:hypothetical protein
MLNIIKCLPKVKIGSSFESVIHRLGGSMQCDVHSTKDKEPLSLWHLSHLFDIGKITECEFEQVVGYSKFVVKVVKKDNGLFEATETAYEVKDGVIHISTI